MPAALKRDGWRECPSVTYGGKPVFYFRRDPVSDVRQWILWDRDAREWTFKDDVQTINRVTSMRADGTSFHHHPIGARATIDA